MDFGEKRRRHLSVAMRKSHSHGQAAGLDSQPGTAALLGAYHAARFALIHVNTRLRLVESSGIRLIPSAGRRLSSQVMASPPPGIPDAPWSASRQYLPGSQQVPSLLYG